MVHVAGNLYNAMLIELYFSMMQTLADNERVTSLELGEASIFILPRKTSF